MSVEKTMLAVTSPWSNQKSFKLIPIKTECPFTEVIFDPSTVTLVVFSKETKQGLHMVPLRDENGDIAKPKGQRKNPDGSVSQKNYKEKQVTLETFTEHYLTEKEEIENLISIIAVNAESFNFKKYLEPPTIITPETPKIEIVK